jgi:tetratricopeptide (TPR) repeat protein
VSIVPRWRVVCDACDAGGWIGPAAWPGLPGNVPAVDGWCEGCQSAHVTEPGAGSPVCPRCGTTLTLGEPRFEELLGEAQNIAAVLSAWCGDPGPLATLLPDRPRFLTDLDPPAPRPGDPEAARAGLDALAHGQFARARDALAKAVRPAQSPGHLWRGLGVAAQRLDDLTLAETAFTRAVEAEPHDTAARLDRGALRVRRRDFEAAREDFALAGDRREARWDRAALRVLEAVATTTGLPEPETLRRAREEAGEPSSYWSDHTVGRLLWTLLLERALSRAGDDAAVCADERVMRAAEHELEFDTFWDRALVVHGYARLGMKREAGESAAALAGALLARLAEEPFARGPAGAWLASALSEAVVAVRERRPGDARAALHAVLERPDVMHYRVPCAACGKGSLGVESYQDEGAEP